MKARRIRVAVLWRAGRWRRGLDQTALIAERIEDLVHTTDWIDHHGHALITLGLTRASRGIEG